MLPTHLRTARLDLRPPTLADAPALFAAYATDPEVTRYMIWKPHESVNVTRSFLTERLRGWESGHDLSWVLEHENRPIGIVGARLEGHRANFGYVLARSEWGRGLMTEAVGALVVQAWAIPSLYRLWAVCDVDNRASARVLEKVAMNLEGTLRRFVVHPNMSTEPRDALCYATTR